jgi:predicted deacetylase
MWEQIEGILVDAGVKPILAVIPDNRDPTLLLDSPVPDFWEHVRRWKGLGWTIGMHGYQHLYLTDHPGLLGINRRSEFAGLSVDQQQERIARGLQVFAEEGIVPEVWIAPSHSFDETTVGLLRSAGLHTISDGLALYPHRDPWGTIWIPQQLWRWRWAPFGVWTICSHHNVWSERHLADFAQGLMRNRSRIADLGSVLAAYEDRHRPWWDTLTGPLLLTALRTKRTVRRALGSIG